MAPAKSHSPGARLHGRKIRLHRSPELAKLAGVNTVAISPDDRPDEPALPILGSAALRLVEATHVQASPSLMERAGHAAAALAALLAGAPGARVLVLAGPGNNGGDGFVLARELLQRGFAVTLASVAPAGGYPADAAQARRDWLDAGGRIDSDFAEEGWALAVDALFGIGLSRPLQGGWADWVARFNVLACPRLALDVPSGLNGDSGALTGPCVVATHTATFIAYKPGLLTLDGPDHCGELSLFDLDVVPNEAAGHVLTPACFATRLQPRRHNVHKGSFGAAGIVGGAAGMQGAALLAARAALHMGPGKVFLGMLAEGGGIDLLHPEIMWRPARDVSAWVDALAIGPGLGQSGNAVAALDEALGVEMPVLFDADALNLLAADPVWMARLARRQGGSVLTPHPAEAARLLGCRVAEVQADRVASALALAQRANAVVVLKGCGSVVAAPDGRWFINRTGHGGMASGGMGDALSGIIVALLAQGWRGLEATLCGVYLHGAAAQALAAEGVGPAGLTASETLPVVRRLFNALTG